MNDTDLATEREETIDWLVDLGVERTGAVTAVDSLIQLASRASQPVQVEVTDDMIARAEREYQWSGNIRKVLVAALGGGE